MSMDGSQGSPLDVLKGAVKTAVSHAKTQQWEPFFATYQALFQHPQFAQNKPEDQRQALKLMIKTKGVPDPKSPQGVAAYQAAWYPLSTLVNSYGDPHDFELLGIVHVRLQDEDGARKLFQQGLDLAQAIDNSELCGELLKHLSFL